MKQVYVVTKDNDVWAVFSAEKEALNYAYQMEKKIVGLNLYVEEVTLDPDWA